MLTFITHMSRAVYFDCVDVDNLVVKIKPISNVCPGSVAQLVLPENIECRFEFQTPVVPIAWDACEERFVIQLTRTDAETVKFTQFLERLHARFQHLLQTSPNYTGLDSIFKKNDKYDPVIVFQMPRKPKLYSINKERIEFEYQNLSQELVKDRRVAVIMSVVVMLTEDECKPITCCRAVLCLEKPFPFDLNAQPELKEAHATASLMRS